MSDDDSLGSAGDDDVQVAAQISSMLKPLTKKQSKMGKRLSALEGVVAKMASSMPLASFVNSRRCRRRGGPRRRGGRGRESTRLRTSTRKM